MTTCTSCGSQLNPGAKFCTICGTRHLPGAGPLTIPGGPSGGPGSVPGGSALPPSGSSGPQPLSQTLLISPAGQQIAVIDGMVIGRDPAACTFFLDVDDVSRCHAVMLLQGGGWAIEDRGSSNGTFVNDQQVFTVTPIYHSDRVRFGSSAEFAFYDPGRPKPAGNVVVGTRLIGTSGSGGGGGQGSGGLGGGGSQGGALITGGSAGQLPQRHHWPKAPLAEGHVLSLRGPIAVEKDGKVGKALFSVGLALINPALAILPWAMGRNQIMVTTLRVKNLDDGRQIAVTLLGDAKSIIDDGDLIAVWGKVEQGTIYAVVVYNYTTDAMIQFKQ